MSLRPIPTRLEAITPAWLTEALHAGARFFRSVQGRIQHISTGPRVEGIAVTSRVTRLRLQVEGDAEAPAAIVVKLVNPTWQHGSGLHEREVRFFRELGNTPGLPVPACYYADYDASSEHFVLILEDVGDVRPGHRLAGVRGAEAELLFDTLASWHANWWESARLKASDWPGKVYSLERARDIWDRFSARWPQLCEMAQFAVAPAVQHARSVMDASFAERLVRLAAGPRTLIHSDLHAENFLIDATGPSPRLIALDWQNAAFGHPAFDIANALTSLHHEVDASERTRLLDRYYQRLGQTDYDRAQLTGDARTGVHWLFCGGVNWLVTFEVEQLRDSITVQGHWTRLAAAFVCSSA